MKKAFTDMILRHQGTIHKVCRVYRDTPIDREDLFQEIAYQLWKAFPSFRQESQEVTWIYRIALNTAISQYRRKKTPIVLEEEGKLSRIHRSQDTTHPEKERLYFAISQLNDTEKALITLYLDQYSYEEMAQIIGISSNHIGVKLNRIKNKIRWLLQNKNI